MEFFQVSPQLSKLVDFCLVLGRGGRFLSCVSDAVEAGLNLSSANGEVHCTVLWMNDRVGYGQWTTSDESFLGRDVGGTFRFHVDGMDFAPAPVQKVHGILVFCGKLRSIAKGYAGRRTWAHVDNRRQGVGIEFGALAGAVAPAPHRAAGDVAHAGGSIPRSVEVIFHVGVVGEQVTCLVEGAVKDIAIAG